MSETVAESVTRARHAVAEEIRALLGRRRLSDIAVARKLGRSHTYVYRRLTGEIAFDIDDLEGIAELLNVSMGDLLPSGTRRHRPTDYEGEPGHVPVLSRVPAFAVSLADRTPLQSPAARSAAPQSPERPRHAVATGL